MMPKIPRSEILARLLLTVGALLPYLPLLTLGTVYITDDHFASDIYHGELPFRAIAGEMMSRGELPLWTDKLCSGFPVGVTEPVGLSSFALLPTATALDVFLIFMLLVAAHGAYGFARRIGAGRPGAVLAGIAFAASGYLVCQLKHLSIVSTVVWLPLGLSLLDGALSDRPTPRMVPEESDEDDTLSPSAATRWLKLTLFGLVFAEQVLAGFPQSAYICGLVYGSFALFRVATLRGRVRGIPRYLLWLAGAGLVVGIAVGAGAVVLLPLSELGSTSYRGEALGYNWSVANPYWPPNALMFLWPYANGDVSNVTYRGPSIFWEDYAYVGIATVLLAIYGVVRERRRPHVIFLGAMVLMSYLIVLGPATPVFKIAWHALPGFKLFRFPTRFLVVVDFGLAVLAAVGLTRFGADLRVWLEKSAPRAPQWLVVGLSAATALDLFIHQPRQNPMVPAREWLAPPQMVELLKSEQGEVRTMTLEHRSLHRRVFEMARGWTDVGPYYAFRESLQPNTGAYWGIGSVDCYSGIAPLWVTNTWGDHSLPGLLIPRAVRPLKKGEPPAAVAAAFGALGVTHLITPFELTLDGMTHVGQAGGMNLYRIEGAGRVRVVARARQVASDTEAADLLMSHSFAPNSEVLLHDVPAGFGPLGGEAASPAADAGPVLTARSNATLLIDAVAPSAGGYLVLADTYYPGWRAEVDGTQAPIVRANLTGRAVRLPPGRHQVKFVYEPKPFFRGLRITLACVSALLVGAVVAAVSVLKASRSRRVRQTA